MVLQRCENIVNDNILKEIYYLVSFHEKYLVSVNEIILIFIHNLDEFRYDVLNIFSKAERF